MQIDICKISKVYSKKVHAVKDLSFMLRKGILGLIGPNGAGKTTLLKILATVMKPTDGVVEWNGRDIHRAPDAMRTKLGYLPQEFGVYPNLTAVEFLNYLAALKGLDKKVARRRIDELIVILNMRGYADRALGSCSGGMKQRVGIAQALLNDPDFLILDEPMVGLDPEERINFLNLLSDLSNDKAIILSTHIVSDVEDLATSIAFLHGGELVEHSSPELLLTKINDKTWEMSAHSSELAAIKKRYTTTKVGYQPGGVKVRIVGERPSGSSVTPVTPTLEDSFIYMLSGRKEGLL